MRAHLVHRLNYFRMCDVLNKNKYMEVPYIQQTVCVFTILCRNNVGGGGGQRRTGLQNVEKKLLWSANQITCAHGNR